MALILIGKKTVTADRHNIYFIQTGQKSVDLLNSRVVTTVFQAYRHCSTLATIHIYVPYPVMKLIFML